ncbi:MAG: fused signal recognition particle receptor [Patiriisocius sp.]|jgi:fused signal recognition particle receptor
MIKVRVPSLYQQLNSEAYTKMSKLFSWFKKDKTEQESANPAPQIEAESQTQLEAEQPLVQAPDSEQAASDKPAAQAPVLETMVCETKTVSQTPADFQEQELPEAKIEVEEDTASQFSLFTRLKASLSRTKNTIGSGFSSLLMGKTIDDDLYEELETQLLLADVGMNTTNKIINELTKNAKRSSLKDGEALSALLQLQMQTILDKVHTPIDFSIATDSQGNKHPFVILMVGVNGVGKTTTIGKLAKQFQAQGKTVMLAAGDTFRAAAVEQLQVWGERNNIPVVAQHTGADSASVIYDAIESAKAKKVDVLIADTAGRLQNKEHLIEELKKVVRVMKKLNPQAPHEIMLTLDASTGQNAVSQTKIFNEAVGITGINLTKLDGTAKGGVIFALADQFAIPVRYIGIGEGIDDLRTFESKAFVDALFSE